MTGLMTIVLLLCVSNIIGADESISSSLNRNKRKHFTESELVYDPNCDTKYTKLAPKHAMCYVDVGVDKPLTQADKDGLVAEHNKYRRLVKPTATNMLKLIWDDELAQTASKWARQCKIGHDPSSGHKHISFPNASVGQNMNAGKQNVVNVVKGWYDEVKDYTYGVGPKHRGDKIGHYTQVVFHDATRVGCGSAICKDNPYYYFNICNYYGGQDDLLHPYTKGESCSACPNKCSDKLCDCKGKVCQNDGTLDPATCTCTCTWMYKGDSCEKRTYENCPRVQPRYCGKHYKLSDCTYQIWLQKKHRCPMTCEICPYRCVGMKCENRGKLDYDTCKCICGKYNTGATCAEYKPDCTKADRGFCQWNKDKCSTDKSFKYILCPHLCGACKGN